MLSLHVATNPFQAMPWGGSGEGVFEHSDTKTILGGEALANEARAAILAGIVLSNGDLGFEAMRNTVQTMVQDSIPLPSRGSFRNWAMGSLQPAGLIIENKPRKYQATVDGRDALSLAGALFELSERHDKSLLTATGKAQGDRASVFARRIAAIRIVYESIHANDGELELAVASQRLKILNSNEALSYIKRLSQTALFTVEASTVVTNTYFEPDDDIDMPMAKNAGRLQELFALRIKGVGRLSFEELVEAGVEGELLQDDEVSRVKARSTLYGMVRRGQIMKTDGRFVDGYTVLGASPKQMEYMNDILDALDAYAAKDRQFMSRYGRYALDICNDASAVSRIIDRAIEATGKYDKSANNYSDDCILRVLSNEGGTTLCSTDITNEIAALFDAGEIDKPVSVITVRKRLNWMVMNGVLRQYPAKSNAHLYSLA